MGILSGIPPKIQIRGKLLWDRNRLKVRKFLARPERLELPTYWFEASRSIHLSYGRAVKVASPTVYRLAGRQIGLLDSVRKLR